MLPDALRLQPILFERPWGGDRLAGLGRGVPSGVDIGESWEVADLVRPDGHEHTTPVAGGPLDGLVLSTLIDRFGPELLGSAGPMPDGRFPLLVKLLDARQNLSVQVHPPASVADADPTVRAKDESWYVLDAAPEARMWFDIRADVSDDLLADAVGDPRCVELLGVLPARRGDFHHIPAGRVHALGAGVLVLEVQTPSDTTFRIFDWTDRYDRPPRELHPEAALRSIVRGDPAAVSVAAAEEAGTRHLVTTRQYWIDEHRPGGDPVALDPRPELRVVFVCDGWVRLGEERLSRGGLRLLPAASSLIGPLPASSDAVVIEVGIA